MWLKIRLQNWLGLPPDSRDLLIRALQENNALLRAQLELAGVKPPAVPPPVSSRPFRKLTRDDVTVMTRDRMKAIEDRHTTRQDRLRHGLPADADQPPDPSPIAS